MRLLFIFSCFTSIVTFLPAQETAKEVAQEAALAVIPPDSQMAGRGPVRRAGWFKKLWESRRSAWAKEIEKKQGALVFLGDSITQGWGDDFMGAFGDDQTKVANRGINGDTTRGMLYRLPQDVLALNPSGVVLLMGTNDIEEDAIPETISGNLKLIIEALKASNEKMPIILCHVFPSHETRNRSAEQIQELNKFYAAVVKDDPQVIQVNTWKMFANENGDARKEEFPDLLHPNELGYQMWGDTLRPVLETHDLVQVPQDDFQREPGYESLFNGKDLSGWGYRKGEDLEKTESFEGKVRSSENRYLAKHGRLIVTTPPSGRAFTALWTEEEFSGDFTLKLEFRANADADSGVYLRGPQLQCRDYLVAGPYHELKKYKAGGWNELVVEVNGELARCTCNGELLEEAMKLPKSGPIGLEGDRGQMEYRRIRILKK